MFVGLIPFDPETATGTVLDPSLIVALVAFDVDQVSVELDPRVTVDGLAVNVEIAGGGTTFTVTCLVTDTAAVFVAFNVYVVVVAGGTDKLPDSVTVTVLIPSLRVTVDALDVDQVSVDDWPAVIRVDDGVNELMTGGACAQAGTPTKQTNSSCNALAAGLRIIPSPSEDYFTPLRIC